MAPSAADVCAPGRHDCEQVCVRDGLLYSCDCHQGYTLNPDGKTCSSKSRLLIPAHPCPPQTPACIAIALDVWMCLCLSGELSHLALRSKRQLYIALPCPLSAKVRDTKNFLCDNVSKHSPCSLCQLTDKVFANLCNIQQTQNWEIVEERRAGVSHTLCSTVEGVYHHARHFEVMSFPPGWI